MKEKLEAKLVDMWISTRNKKKNFSFCWGKLFHKAGIFFIRFSSFSFLQSFNIEATTKMNFTLGNHCAKNFHFASFIWEWKELLWDQGKFPSWEMKFVPNFSLSFSMEIVKENFSWNYFSDIVCLSFVYCGTIEMTGGVGKYWGKVGRKDFNGASNKCSGSS